jgi:hypothetical protein
VDGATNLRGDPTLSTELLSSERSVDPETRRLEKLLTIAIN